MPRNVADILREIETFQPSDGYWLPLDGLLAELWDVGVPVSALPTLRRVRAISRR
jgi:hypothetical protein